MEPLTLRCRVLQMPQRPLILLEFNELSPVLMDRFIGQGALPNFARFRSEAECHVTDAGEDSPNLNPWIQWVTVHSGQSFAQHKVFHLGDAAARKVPMIWDHVGAAGHSAWVCGSMNIATGPDFKGWVLPDPWDATTPAKPDGLNAYIKLVRGYVFGYTSGKRPVTLGTIAEFISFMLRNGLSMSTISRIARQLAGERLGDISWRRASILDRLQFDLFASIYKRHKPLLSTFFLNSTAHYQHAFWRNMQPEVFTIKPSESDQKWKGNAVLYGYQTMDELLGRVMAMAGNEAVIAFATGLSQQACLAWEGDGGKTFYKPHDHATLLALAGIDASTCKVEPVMSEQFHIRFRDEAQATAALARLNEVVLDNGRRVLNSRQEGDSVFSGCGIFGDLPGGVRIRGAAREASFTEFFYQIEAIKSGMHHRDGMFWVRTPERRAIAHEGKLALTEIMPILLGQMGIATAVRPRVSEAA